MQKERQQSYRRGGVRSESAQRAKRGLDRIIEGAAELAGYLCGVQPFPLRSDG